MPAIEADIKFAIVPAIMARKPRRASSPLLIRRQCTDAADLNSDRTEIGESAQRECGNGKRARIEQRLLISQYAKKPPVHSRPCACPADFPLPRSRATGIPITHAIGAEDITKHLLQAVRETSAM